MQILAERSKLPSDVRALLSQYVSGDLLEMLVPEKEFWTAQKTLEFLAKEDFFKEDEELRWPDALKDVIDEGEVSPECHR